MPLRPGDRLGRYEVRSLVGSGGMGEVYVAHDAKLGRSVALKLLLERYTGNDERLRRFAQEARAASALNHPNIVTVYDVDVDGDTHFIATEFVDGETLRARLQRGRLPLPEALRVATQVADALAAAHREGIVHRDIKPDNILLRRDGYVKVVDFGLAKLADADANADSLETTRRAMETSAGVILGTVAYMSPEQARGFPVDARTDLWSLGVVLYEMIAGRRPFEGPTSSDVSALILQRDPPKLSARAPEAAGGVELVVETALAKNVEDRYQSARELLNALKRVQRYVEGANARSLVAPSAQARKRRTALVIAALAVAVLSLTVGIYRARRQPAGELPTQQPASFERFTIARLTSSSRVRDAAISPDGRYVVHSVDDGPGQSLWVRQVKTSSNVQIVKAAHVSYVGMTFSPDGDYVYYVSRNIDQAVASLYRIPVLGGVSRKLLDEVDTSITFSPDGSQIAFVRAYADGSTSMIVANADGSGVRRLATLALPSAFAIGGVEPFGPAWSPDGTRIATAMDLSDSTSRHAEIGIVDIDGGRLAPLTDRRWYMVRRVAWLGDGSGVLAAVADKSGAYSAQQIWRIPYPAGEPHKLTNDLSNYGGVSTTATSRAFVSTQTSTTSRIWMASADGAGIASVVTPGGSTVDGTYGVTWTPDSRIVYSSAANGTFDLWTMKADGSDRRPLTPSGGANIYPDVSRDGKMVVLSSDREHNDFQIWRIGIDGNGMTLLTRAETAWAPKSLPDGSLLYSSGDRIWRVSADGGEPVAVTNAGTSRPAVSPDGKLFVCSYRDSTMARSQLAVYQVGGTTPLKRFDIPATADRQAQWAPDGRSVHYIDTQDGVSNVWSLSLKGGPPTQITRFATERIFVFAWSRDGTRLALSRGTIATDAVLFTSEK